MLFGLLEKPIRLWNLKEVRLREVLPSRPNIRSLRQRENQIDYSNPKFSYLLLDFSLGKLGLGQVFLHL